MYTEKQPRSTLALQPSRQHVRTGGTWTDHSPNTLFQTGLKNLIGSSPALAVQRKTMAVIQRELPAGTKDTPIPGGRTYRQAYDENLGTEIKIGTSLISNKDLNDIAQKIGEKSQVPDYEEQPDKTEINTDRGEIGGAEAYASEIPTLDAHVFRTMLAIEGDPAERRRLSIPQHDVDDVYIAGVGKKEEFDLPMKKASYEKLPISARIATDMWGRKEFKDLDDRIQEVIKKSVGSLPLKDRTAAETALYRYDDLPEDAKHILLEGYRKSNQQEEKFRKKYSGTTNTTLQAALKSMEAPHNHGNHINLVNPDTAWFKSTRDKGMPMISGPSGHTMRYLNYWQKIRRNNGISGDGPQPEWPSLEAARLVMLANLMPPKMHHSYTEIMVASEGVGLPYNHKNNYEDLNEQHERDAQGIAKEAYKASLLPSTLGAERPGGSSDTSSVPSTK